MPTKSIDSKSKTPVPIEFAGQWIAWDAGHSRIVAHSDTIKDLWRIVRSGGVTDPVFEKVPRADVRFVGTQ